MANTFDDNSPLSILVVTQGQWGERIADNLHRFAPTSWRVERWAAPKALPPFIDDPTDFLPASFAPADLVLALGDTAAVAQLIPDIARLAGAQAVIAPIDRNESMPPGLVQQLRGWLDELKIASVFPKPFCSLTETTYNLPPVLKTYDNPCIQLFAHYFGKPLLRVTVDDAGQRIELMDVVRDSACGCARYVAQGLAATPVADAEYRAGMMHHHYPCLASMNQDADYGDTLMHVSGYLIRAEVKAQIQAYLAPTPYFRPHGQTD